jgi:hypothetical protein
LILVAGPGVAAEAHQALSQPYASSAQPEASLPFDIPAQPLARALVAYGDATGLEVYYNAAVAQGRVSAAVKGEFTPSVALRMLLAGSGLVPRVTGPGDFTVVPAPHAPPSSAATAVAWAGGAYEPYFATIQAPIADALCRAAGGAAADGRAIIRVWLDASGRIARADSLAAGAGDAAAGRALAGALEGLMVGPPPAGMPEPVTLAIFPPAAERCSPVRQGAD